MSRRRLPVQAQLLALGALLLVFTATIAVIAIGRLASVDDRADFAYERGTVPLGQLGDARTLLAEQRIATRDVFLATDDAARKALIAKMTASGKQVDTLLAAVGPTLVTPKGKASFAALGKDLADYRSARGTLMTSALGGATQQALIAQNGRTVKPVADRLTADFAALYTSKIDVSRDSHQSISDTYASARTTLIVLLIAALLLGVAVAWLIARRIRRNLAAVVAGLGSLRDEDVAELSSGLTRYADGDLTHRADARTEPIAVASNDEIGDVARATDAIRVKIAESLEAYEHSRATLSQIIGEVSQSAATVSAGSQQMAASSDETGRAVTEIASAVGEVAVGAQRQVETIEQLRGAAEEVSQITGRAAENLQTTAGAAEQARTLAADGSQAIGLATDAMTTVRDASEQTTVRIRALGAKSDQIGGIVDTISGIAEQTNLLALNAAIEAARAGEQGRGFAVVAEEVRKLAEESQSAATSISALVGEIQQETGLTIEAVESGATRTREGVEIVERAGASFQAIGASVDDVTARVAEVAAAAQQIVASAEAMRHDMADVAGVAEQSSASTEQVSASTQQTSASAQEISASAQELATTAETLQQLVARFQLTEA